MTLTLSEPKPKRAPKPATDTETLRRLAARIEEMRATRMDELIEELAAEGGRLTDKGPARGYELKLAGITATGTGGQAWALANWAMAARREVLKREG